MTAMRGSTPPTAAGSSVATRPRTASSRFAMSEENRQRGTEPGQVLLRVVDASGAIREQVVEIHDEVRRWAPREPEIEEVHGRKGLARVEVLVATDERERADELVNALDVESDQMPPRRIAAPDEEFAHQLVALALPEPVEPA